MQHTQKRTMANFLTWYRTIKKKWWVEPGFVARKTSRLKVNVKYNIKMATLHDRTPIQINGKHIQERESHK